MIKPSITVENFDEGMNDEEEEMSPELKRGKLLFKKHSDMTGVNVLQRRSDT